MLVGWKVGLKHIDKDRRSANSSHETSIPRGSRGSYSKHTAGSGAGGGNVMCVCLYQKSVCQFKVPKVCTVGLYST